MNNIVPFRFEDHAISVITDESGEPWFVAKEVAEVLGYSDAFEMTKRLDDDEKQNRRSAGLTFRRHRAFVVMASAAPMAPSIREAPSEVPQGLLSASGAKPSLCSDGRRVVLAARRPSLLRHEVTASGLVARPAPS